MDFLLLAKFWASPNNLYPPSTYLLNFTFRIIEAHEALHRLYGPNYRVTEEVEIIQGNLSKLRERNFVKQRKQSEYKDQVQYQVSSV